jgi:hypothetical protein
MIDDPNSDKAKKFQAFNKQLASVYKTNVNYNHVAKQLINIKEKENEGKITSSLSVNNKSVNPNSLNYVLKNMNKLSTNTINLKSLQLTNIK